MKEKKAPSGAPTASVKLNKAMSKIWAVCTTQEDVIQFFSPNPTENEALALYKTGRL